MNERKIEFEELVNCRDLGGLLNREGKTIRKGVLIRTAKLFKASEADIRKLSEDLRLKKIIDLRTTEEVQEKPDKVIPGAEHLHIAIFDEVRAGISREEGSENKSDMFISDMAGLYAALVSDEVCQNNFSRALKTIMAHDPDSGSILWHCTEGKDRCGLTTMFILSMLGVDRKYIMDDYLLTNEVNEARAEMIYLKVLEKGRDEPFARAVRESFLAKPEYLQAAFDAIDGKFGGIDNYLQNCLSISDEEIEAFRKKLLN